MRHVHLLQESIRCIASLSLAIAACLTLCLTARAQELASSGPITLNGKHGAVIEGKHITSTHGDCIHINGSSDITIKNSEIGPCGGNGVWISGGEGIRIVDSYIHPETQSPGCCDHNDGVFALETSGLMIQGNVIAYGESNIEVHAGTKITVKGNFLLNPRGPKPRGQNFQCWTHSGRSEGPGCSDITVENNYAVSSDDTQKYLFPENQEDSINFGHTDGVVARGNFITGGHSRSGCGLIADKGASNVLFANNRLLDTGQCGIGIADGHGNVVDGNTILNRNPVPGAGNQGIYVWQSYHEKGDCADSTVRNNVSLVYKTDGSKSGFWKGSGCDPLRQENNKFAKDAVESLKQVDQIFRPPMIPPEPFECVAPSPYSNQTSLPACRK
jgi:hypothetical protein